MDQQINDIIKNEIENNEVYLTVQSTFDEGFVSSPPPKNREIDLSSQK